MQSKPKKCKGIGIGNGFNGCGVQTLNREHGLCSSCRYEFYMTDERGKIEFEKRKIKIKSVKEKAFKSDLKDKIKTLSDYAKELQKEVNTIVRLIDKGSVCISTLKPLNEKFDAGHFYSVGSNPTIRFNLFNIYAQSVYANQYLSGDQTNFMNGLSQLYGEEHKDYVLSLKGRYSVLKLTKDDYKEKIKIAREIVKELKNNISPTTIYNNSDRLYLRLVYNQRLQIYIHG